MKRRIGVLLCGCGAFDGTDPAEALALIAAIQELGHEPVLLTPSGPLGPVINHLTGEETPSETRELSQESSRIYRGKYHLIDDISPKLLDALVIPGGQGPFKTFLDAEEPSGWNSRHLAVRQFIEAVHAHGGAIGALSLSEFLLSNLFGPFPTDRNALELAPGEVLSDPSLKLVLGPGHLTAQSLPQLREGAVSLMKAMVTILESPL